MDEVPQELIDRFEADLDEYMVEWEESLRRHMEKEKKEKDRETKSLNGYHVKAGFTGKREDKLGRVYCWNRGQRVPCKNPQVKPRGEKKPEGKTESIKDVFKEIQTLRKEKPTAKQVNALAKKLAGLTVAELQRIKKELKVKASGKKAELAKKIVKEAVKGEDKLKRPVKKPVKKPLLPDVSFPIPKIPKSKFLEKFFGKKIDDKTLAGMSNLVKGGKVSIFQSETDEDESGKSYPALHIQFENGVISHRSFFRKNGKLIVHNDSFAITKNSQYKGRGLQFFVSQVNSLKKAGISRIETHAAGNRQSNMFNGYYTWPRMGYDGTIQNRHFSALSEDLRKKMGGSRSILKLFKLPGGKEEWKEKGGDILDAFFDLSDDSPNMKALAAYVKEREARE